MEIIKPLSEAVQSRVRSGFIIGCLASVVEELIYNSLDAGATKVLVSVAVNNGYVKVEDDGSGISRDGLVLLGERYATSKVRHFHGNDAFVESFGFRGEVLCSIADISLLEIITRVQGRPNGYRKVMKGRKCLCLSIDNDRLEVGTTVIVRDLFYNQPVRRRQMQCSVKKVLHSVKKGAVRIALVRPTIFFKVIDMESENELLCTRTCPSPLSLLSCNFGIEACSLHELSFSEGSLKLTGYVSALSSSFSSKAVQYIYVNSRFVNKGPIHKLLNSLADMFNDRLIGDRGEKRGQPHAGPSYCLNLTCPRYSYDLNLEFSMASIEFKDWAPILSFVEKSVASFWGEETKRGTAHKRVTNQTRKDGIEKAAEQTSSVKKGWALKSCEISAKRRRHNNDDLQAPTGASREMLVEDFNLSPWKNISRRCMNSDREESPGCLDFTWVDDSSHCTSIFKFADGVHNGLRSDEELVTRAISRDDDSTKEREAHYVNSYLPISRWNEEINLDIPYSGSHDICSFEFALADRKRTCDEQRKVRLQSCSWDSPDEAVLSFNGFPIEDFTATRTNSNSHVNEDAYSLGHSFNNFERAQCDSEVTSSWLLPRSDIGSPKRRVLDIDNMECDNLLLPSGESFNREFHIESPSSTGRVLFPSLSIHHGLQPAIACPSVNLKGWDVDIANETGGFKKRLGVRSIDDIDQFYYEKEDFHRDSPGNRCSNKDFPSTSFMDSISLFTGEFAGKLEGTWELSQHGDDVDKLSSIKFGDLFFEDSCSSSDCWSPLISSNKGMQMNLERSKKLGQDYVPIERSERNYDSPGSLCDTRSGSLSTNETFSPYLYCQSNFNPFKSSVHCFSPVNSGRDPKLDLQRCQAFVPKHSCSEPGSSVRSRRSNSAPPFYKGKKKFSSVKSSLISSTDKSALRTAPRIFSGSERTKLVPQPTPAVSSIATEQHDAIRSGEESLFCFEKKVKETSNSAQFSTQLQDGSFNIVNLKKVQASESSQIKWREGCPDATLLEIPNYLKAADRLIDPKGEIEILDIQSSMLDLSGNSLVPKSISRSGLENAKVLSQVDNKFIPVVANGTLAVIDQHAADERIRLEDMRQKVLSGEMKSITYLEEEKDLVLPEMAYQLLCNYAERIKQWGWICNIFSEDSRSFTKNLNLLNERTSHVTLIAVPCILGVNLSDGDLLEFLEQLADTDGSSNIPPSVVRVLNYKACRGAIMFGDKLMPSECSLIVEELKRTSLCFQCAHGRPTTVPLVDLKAFHEGIMRLGSWHVHSENTWHGLCRNEISLDRARHRLDVARG